MAIQVTRPRVVDGSLTTKGVDPVEMFKGRVLRIEKVVEDRNWSDTMDYTDHRSTNCVYALVWLGTHGIPPLSYGFCGGRSLVQFYMTSDEPRDLEYWEQFAWVDCTNLFVWRGSDQCVPEVDAEMGKGGEPLMWANLLAWESHQVGLANERRRKAEEAENARLEAEKKKLERAAKKEAKREAQKADVESRMLKTPERGTVCTVDGFTGKVFWKGVKLYRGAWRGTVGLKDDAGRVAWIDVEHWTPSAARRVKPK